MNAEGSFQIIDQTGWQRREQFQLFRSLQFPYFSITADVDITEYRRVVPHGGGFTLGITYAIAAAANQTPPLRQRIRGDDVIEFEVVHPSIIVLTDEEACRFCAFPFSTDYRRFSCAAAREIEAARRSASLFDFKDQLDFLFMTSIPWIAFTGMTHATMVHEDDSVPRIAWGQTKSRDGRTLLPLNVQVHHALVDGIHVGRFYAAFEEIMHHATDWYG